MIFSFGNRSTSMRGFVLPVGVMFLDGLRLSICLVIG